MTRSSFTTGHGLRKLYEKRSKSLENSQPAMVSSSASPDREEWDNVIAFTGSASLEKAGPLVGSVDVAESMDEYLFRVSLPGVTRDEKVISCEVRPDGRIVIKGESATGESTVCKHSMVFKMQTQNLCPPGEFTVSIQLPGPIDHLTSDCVFGTDGIFEGVVKKKKKKQVL
ncbi:alpha-crystallin domain-containing protein 22.3-like [Capsicum annuum]|uniref:alpha-crystallin domain-containing protein 22.3-like n=1 Tax=Capsicum annuum TaxID=4072 RepID=UPI001FB08C7A|nr:alpha-crystallin domain-containing protein 22.3-like [Capsicum annuum]XP_047252006.1 alpha-crystallin domain-containing protein 22.3-like [Capsicum annuum]